MDYEKEYKEARKRAKIAMAKCRTSPLATVTAVGYAISYIFNEPDESEDERIRKTLINIVKGACGKYGIKYKGEEITEEKLLSHLERQKEQKPGLKKANDLQTWLKIVDKVLTEFQGIGQYLDNPICQEIANMLREKYCFDDASSDWDRVYRKGLDAGEIYGYNKAKKEQKPAQFKGESLAEIIKGEFEGFRSLLKKKGIDYEPQSTYWENFARLFDSSAREYLKEQKPAGWSEEDEEIYQALILEIDKYEFFAGFDSEIIISFLKSLRHKPHWKPSEYTLSLVKKAADGEMLTGVEQMAIGTLYEQLKRL